MSAPCCHKEDNIERHQKRWSSEEVQFLIDNYKNFTIAEIANHLKRTVKSVRGKAEQLVEIDLASLNRIEHWNWTAEELSFLIENYDNLQDREIAIALFGEDTEKAKMRVFRKRRSLNLIKTPLGIRYNEMCKDYNRRMCKGKVYYEHIENAEAKIGRKIKEGEVVHHISGNKKDNSFENLFICGSNREHKLLHIQLGKLALKLVEAGVIKFDEQHKEYKYIDKATRTEVRT